jgi:hypothetical protein
VPPRPHAASAKGRACPLLSGEVVGHDSVGRKTRSGKAGGIQLSLMWRTMRKRMRGKMRDVKSELWRCPPQSVRLPIVLRVIGPLRGQSPEFSHQAQYPAAHHAQQKLQLILRGQRFDMRAFHRWHENSPGFSVWK